ncbi:expressed unknown protein [Ectocarpus siliculosus]|uniref:Uncharacterized protein n=1 Tax=Ectocarpus siliculosus TaxID=2880 RepID=D8LHZ5_ECTSI|nr:expressed unknown protein [Ectocarpus siliculosus]|eukprot:CBN74426.1 expressed unknown protein [Ectocarpus siliculosus]
MQLPEPFHAHRLRRAPYPEPYGSGGQLIVVGYRHRGGRVVVHHSRGDAGGPVATQKGRGRGRRR